MTTTFSVYNPARNDVFDSSKAGKELGYVTHRYQKNIWNEIQRMKDKDEPALTILWREPALI